MRKYTWVMASCCSETAGICLVKFTGTVEEIKEELMALIKGDMENNRKYYFEGTMETKDLVDVYGNELEFLGYNMYSDENDNRWHIEYTAKRIDTLNEVALSRREI